MRQLRVSGGAIVRKRGARPPVVLTFLAPASRCNQRCLNCYLTEVSGEPVHSFALSPRDYALFLTQFFDAGIPVLSVKFQGYEVTLASSWSYVEAVFRVAQERGVRRSFITNGMLLHKWVDRIRDLGVARITVSLDGATPEVNDAVRGLPGAFRATTGSLRRLLDAAPEYRERVAIYSLLRGTSNFESLLEMPAVVRDLGLTRWIVGVELAIQEGEVRPVLAYGEVIPLLDKLQTAAERHAVHFHVSDEYRALPRDQTQSLAVISTANPQFFYRVNPTGHVHTGRGLFERWDPERLPLWDPKTSNAVETVRYEETVEAIGPKAFAGGV